MDSASEEELTGATFLTDGQYIQEENDDGKF